MSDETYPKVSNPDLPLTDQWEYVGVHINLEPPATFTWNMNYMGARGWEMVSFSTGLGLSQQIFAIFKRRKDVAEKEAEQLKELERKAGVA
jgi:hypothetical protein